MSSAALLYSLLPEHSSQALQTEETSQVPVLQEDVVHRFIASIFAPDSLPIQGE